MPDVNYSDLIGLPFDEFGPTNGHNCWTLIQEVGKRAGIEYPDREFVYELASRSRVIFETAAEFFVRIRTPEPYCVVVFKMHPGLVSHMGIVLEDKVHFLHVMRKRCVCRERLDDDIWSKKIEGFYVKNLDYNEGQ